MRALAVVGLFVLLAGCAQQIQQFTLQDIRAGQARAEKAGDATWATCMKTLGDHLEQRMASDVVPPAGLVDAVVAAHLIRQKARDGVPSQLKADCAEVALDILLFAARLGLKFAGPL